MDARTGITGMQQDILDCIENSVNERGYAPSLREIGDSVGLHSTSSVSYQLSILEARKYIELGYNGNGRTRGSRKFRAIKVLNGKQREPVKLNEEELAQLRGLGQGEVPAVVEAILNERLKNCHCPPV